MSDTKNTPAHEAVKPANFLRAIIERDLEAGTYAHRPFGGTPGDAAHHAAGQPDPAKVRLRFPPEPNGYLHVGHAKSICLNFGLARDYGGVCHLRFDDTNPEKEEQEYVDAIEEMVKWLGWDWNAFGTPHLYYASNYFDFMYRAAETLIERGQAYVDEQTPEEMRANRGDFTTPGTNSPFRDRTVAENLARFREMRDGRHADGSMVLRAKIDMASPNINLRDPAIYRIRRATHHNTGDKWCIYPMYTFAHPIEDALERITHSICTLEFEDQRPFYDWLLENLADAGLLAHPLPKQYEFGRLNLSYVVTSKRKLKQLVDEKHVSGWDDPRMPTLAGMRRRGYTPAAVRKMADDTGASKTNAWIDYSVLDIALRADLEEQAPRAMAVIDPVKLKLTNYAEVFGSAEHREPCSAPAHPHHPELGQRSFSLGPELWIEREDFAEVPPKGFFRLFPGNKVRLKYGYVIECTGCEKDADGSVTAVTATVLPDTKSGTPGADAVKVKGVLTWVGVHDGVAAEIRLFDRLFTEAQPDAGGRDFLSVLNPGSKKIVQGYLEPSLAHAPPEARYQFERHGYFVTDRLDHRADAPVINRITGLRDSWAK
ncbi:glutamine--tRNA ligase/YqeY domain fusion protein [Ideonella dechloratans]|uniref:Glutamine--tRNA ligase n=1 Tax=Ideonella dechloratans TaxID=36863 RepID=A0A643F7I6_IDEDE|nr:glutamine--tRNA ligase/YqeY domain fusion protein [Ideonella dechloratans]KAB0576490.1 glutamine--tRNA ligase/YqeY domain fusion protein [Ideonella dechloratans]UFU11317.1 glutamine--tRNA ligase/YqeY domain fusion protein [Ideonella dechloratans]